MTMNLKQMLTRVMRPAQSENSSRWSESDLIGFLNSGQEEMAKASQKTVVEEVSLAEGYHVVAFPDDMLLLHDVYWQTDDYTKKELFPSLGRLPVNDESTGDPKRYHVKEGRLELRPIPDADGTVSIAYVPRPTALEEYTDTPELEGAGEAMISYALYRLYFENGNDGNAAKWQTDYAKKLGQWLASYDSNYQTAFKVKSSW